ncbi:MAG: hypothetical protein VBE63_14320 [Lamprobacter sp.]|uniref:hypothetical protein n=1 Tax=Lamprobacter sp. TaxID=3100796 RepID=UPI002B2603A7|nr:hypothetical protein [Lamprobacter sp.]MEA3641099.1 hypothetical protein [Lamprobacter sp.]
MRAEGWTSRDSLLTALVIVASIGLLLLNGQQLLAELNRIPVNSYYTRYQSQFLSDDHGPAFVEEAAERLFRVPPAHRGSHEWRRLAAILTMRPLPDETPATLAQHKAAIIEALSQTLARNPVQALGWSYLANIQMPPSGDCQNAMAALRQSFTVAPVEPDFVAYRLELAARCPLAWDQPMLDALRRDLKSLYVERQIYARNRAFMAWLANRPEINALARRLLNKDQALLGRFDRDLKRFSP